MWPHHALSQVWPAQNQSAPPSRQDTPSLGWLRCPESCPTISHPTQAPCALGCELKGHLGSLAVQVGWERLLVKVFKFRCRFLPDHTRHIYMYRLSWSNCGNSKTEFKKRLLESLVRWSPCHGPASLLPRQRTHCVLWGQPRCLHPATSHEKQPPLWIHRILCESVLRVWP